MPRLTLAQWLLLSVFLAFYGFAVFALTRDYYLRHPPRTVEAQPREIPHALPEPSASTFIQREVRSGGASTAAEPTGNDPVQLNRAGDELFAQKRYAEAVPFYRRALEIDPRDPDAANDLGLALHYSGQSGEAIEVLRIGADGSPDFQRIWLTLGFVSARTGNREVARNALERARDMDADNGIGQEAQRLLGLLNGE